MAAGCSGEGGNPSNFATPTPLTQPSGTIVAQGAFTALTYNVAGLPEAISGTSPNRNHPQISPLLNRFDLVLVQEDFCHHALLAKDAQHPFQSTPAFVERPCEEQDRVGDGINDFTIFQPDGDLVRTVWQKCSGTVDCKSDCLTKKGFSFSRHEIAPGVEIDVYNAHTDAGACRGDTAARAAQLEQLAAAIAERSDGRAVLVAGDFNLKKDRLGDPEIFGYFTQLTQTSDDCEDETRCVQGRLDRIVVRGAPNLRVSIVESYLDPDFILRDEQGNPVDEDGDVIAVGTDGQPLDPTQKFVDLSDHKPLVAVVEWTLFD